MVTKVVASRYGGPEVLSVVEESSVSPNAGEVLIGVCAAGTNPVDYKLYSGLRGTDPSQLPIRLGMEGAGIVLATGEGAVGPKGPIEVDDEVIIYRAEGTYASEVIVPAGAVVPKPTTLPHIEAAGLMLAGVTAIHALTVTDVGDGDTVVVHGAAGGVGLMAVQLAINAGARVIGTASNASHPYLRELGVEPVTYGEGLADRIRELAPEGVDAAIDTVGSNEAIDVSIALIKNRNRIVTIAGFERGFELGLKVIGAAPGADPGTEIRAAGRLELARQADAGKLHVRVAATYPLVEAAKAHQELAAGHTHGKIVLIP